MNRAQCERASALYLALEACDRQIAGATKPDSLVVTVGYGDVSLDIKIAVAKPLDSHGAAIHEATVNILRRMRDDVVRELRGLGAEVAE